MDGTHKAVFILVYTHCLHTHCSYSLPSYSQPSYSLPSYSLFVLTAFILTLRTHCLYTHSSYSLPSYSLFKLTAFILTAFILTANIDVTANRNVTDQMCANVNGYDKYPCSCWFMLPIFSYYIIMTIYVTCWATLFCFCSKCRLFGRLLLGGRRCVCVCVCDCVCDCVSLCVC